MVLSFVRGLVSKLKPTGHLCAAGFSNFHAVAPAWVIRFTVAAVVLANFAGRVLAASVACRTCSCALAGTGRWRLLRARTGGRDGNTVDGLPRGGDVFGRSSPQSPRFASWVPKCTDVCGGNTVDGLPRGADVPGDLVAPAPKVGVVGAQAHRRL